MRVDRIANGLWRWTGLHPDWKPTDDWPQAVGCTYLETPQAIVLIDPLIPPEDPDRFLDALDRDVERVGLPVHILLTVEWHARSSEELAARYRATVGGEPPAGVAPFSVPPVDENLWLLHEHGALVAGDVLVGTDGGTVSLCPDSWLEGRSSPDEIRSLLRPLREQALSRVLVSHGEPVLSEGRAALAAALDG